MERGPMFRFDSTMRNPKERFQLNEEKSKNLIKLLSTYMQDFPECIDCTLFLNINEFVRIYSGSFCAANVRPAEHEPAQQSMEFQPPTEFQKKYGRKVCKTFCKNYE